MTALVSYRDFPATAFPLRIELLDAQSRTVRWSAEITGPGVIRVPPCTEVNAGKPVVARVTFADGEVAEAELERQL